jgi:hypothetical protein
MSVDERLIESQVEPVTANARITTSRKVIVDALFYLSTTRHSGSEARVWFHENLPGVILDVDMNRKLGEGVRELLKTKEVRDNFTIKEIEEKYQYIISRAIQFPTALKYDFIAVAVKNFQLSLNKQIQSYQIIIPISNLNITQTFSIGDVQFINFTKYQYNKFSALLYDIIKNNPNYNETEKRKLVKDMKDRILKNLLGKVCARTNCLGLNKRAEEKALNKVNQAVDIIKLYCLNPAGEDGGFGVEGELLFNSRRTILQLTLGTNREFTPKLELLGPHIPMTIDGSKLQIMRRYGMNDLTKILLNQRSSIEKKILISIYWFARAFDAPLRRIDDEKIIVERAISSSKTEKLEYGSTNERLVKLFLAMESLFAISENEAIQNNIAERAAFLLGKKYEERKRIKKFIKDMYTLRSRTVHQGFTYVSIGELQEIAYIVRSSIIQLLTKRNKLGLRSNEDFYSYFERQKFS